MASSHASSHDLALDWAIESSSCARLLTSVQINIYTADSVQQSGELLFSTLNVKAHCLTTLSPNAFAFRVSAPKSDELMSHLADSRLVSCPIKWKRLDPCRRYSVQLETRFANAWKGAPSAAFEIFTQYPNASKGICQLLTNSSGSFSSPRVAYGTGGRSSQQITWLISTEADKQIWLQWSQFQMKELYEHVQIFDGPTQSSASLLLEHSGNSKPPSIRSKSNHLLVNLVVYDQYKDYYDDYYYQRYGYGFTVEYASVSV